MQNSRRILLCCLALAWAVPARADPQTGLNLQRFEAAPAGSGWLMLDDLALEGGLGGALSLTSGYARNLLNSDFVSDLAHANVGLAITWNRLRLSADIGSPLYVRGQDSRDGYRVWVAPRVDIASHPDSLLDTRLGVDARLAGSAHGPARFGMGLHVFLPTGDQSAYLSDGQVRFHVRFLGAGDIGCFSWSALLGLRLQSFQDGHPDYRERGISLGGGAAWRFDVGDSGWRLLVGPELTGVDSFVYGRGLALLTARAETKTASGNTLRIKLAGWANPLDLKWSEWRIVAGIELVGLAASTSPTSR
jgi:hypothetical protein